MSATTTDHFQFPSQEQIQLLRTKLSIESKNGMDFTVSASLVWALLGIVWYTSPKSDFINSVLSFYIGFCTLPLAFGLSKIFKTNWKLEGNPLKPLGLWFNFAQLFYFPLLFVFLKHMPEYFIMAYAIITGAHLFPFSWLYKNPYYGVFGGIISLGSFIIAWSFFEKQTFLVPFFTSMMLFSLSVWLTIDVRKKKRN
ncbi:hypothetical protein LZF95_04215 [Algoriphagus sp. AGSA1]|uniref:DUF7010 family protein n=1 Tax=Algoriphagus sp. AGSA1 TaxID=2907213 RepID=UPI001F17291E|nr:hypothetical protein [Algoriphagus sp. AGSA1]MCE7053872.1 hypothetical protein [Algoriphagus sp. AGSA1]